MSKKGTQGIILTCLVFVLVVLTIMFFRSPIQNIENTKNVLNTTLTQDTQNGRIVFAGDSYKPFSYVGANGEAVGIDVDLAKEACRRLGMQCSYKFISWNEKNKLMADGEVDALWSCYSMDGREDLYAWAGPYLETSHVVVVRKQSNIEKIADLEGKRVIVQNSSQPEKLFLQRQNPNIPQVRVLYSTNEADTMFADLQLGYVDATSTNKVVAMQYVNKYPDDLAVLPEPLMKSHLGVAFPKNKQELSKRFQTVLTEMEQDGTVAKIIDKYEKMSR